MSLKNLSISNRLALVLGLILSLGLLSSLLAVFHLRTMTNEVRAMVSDQLKTERLRRPWPAPSPRWT